jgi:hypothetical protein
LSCGVQLPGWAVGPIIHRFLRATKGRDTPMPLAGTRRAVVVAPWHP